MKREKLSMKDRAVVAILLQSKELKKEYLIDEKNLPYIGEISSVFKLKIFRVSVKTNTFEIMDLRTLSKALCSKNFALTAEYDVIEEIDKVLLKQKIKFNSNVDSSNDIISQIKKKIEEELKSGKEVTVQSIYEQYKFHKNISRQLISGAFRTTRTKLLSSNINIKRIKPGTYQRQPETPVNV